MLCDVPTAISINFQDTMDATVYHCYVVTSISSNFEDALDATLQQPFQSTSSTLWMPRCNTHFEQLGRHFGLNWMLRSNSQFNQLAARYGCYVVTSISSNLEDASDAMFQQPFESTSRTLWMLRFTIATLYHPFRATSKTLWMLPSKSHFNQLPGHYGC